MTPQTQTPERASRASVSGEVADFLIELGSAFQKVGMYPEGHPALAPAVEAVKSRLSTILASRPLLALGVGRDEILADGAPTDASHPLFRALASRLYRHEIGAVTFAEGVTSEEIADVLRLFAADPERSGRPLGAEPESVRSGRPHIRLESARFEELRLKSRDQLSVAERRTEERGLWHSLASAAVAAGSAGPVPDAGDARISGAAREVTQLFRQAESHEGSDPPPAAEAETLDPDELARLLAGYSDDVEFDRTMGRHMATIARTLASLDPEHESDLREQFTRLLMGLDLETLQRLLSMGGDERARRQFLLDAVRGVGADAVLTLMKAASEDSSSDISRWMLRLLTKMAAHAEEGSRSMQSRARVALRDQVSALLEGWNLENPNPEEYERALGQMALHSVGGGGGSDLRAGLEPERLAQMSLEVGVAGEVLAGAVDRLVNSGRAADLVRWVDTAPGGPVNEAALHTWDRLSEPSVVRRLVEEEQPDFDCLDRVLPRAGLTAAGPLLDRLATAESLSVRRGMFDRVAALGPEAGPLALRRLQSPDETPWYVLRNMLSLMAVLPRWPVEFDPAHFRSHPHPQVRFEALRLCMRLSDRRSAAILQALGDEVGRIRALGIVESEAGAPPEAEPALCEAALHETEDPEIRLPAIRALGRLRTPGGRDALLKIAGLRRRRPGRRKAEATPARLAALRALARGWPGDAGVRAILSAAAASGDPALREAATAPESPPAGGDS